MCIYHLLQEQEGFTGSYNVVQRYVKKMKKREKERRNLELISAWAIASRMKSRKRNCSRDSMPSTISCVDSVLPGQDMKKGTSRTRSAISVITYSSRSPNSMIGMNSTDNCCSLTRIVHALCRCARNIYFFVKQFSLISPSEFPVFGGIVCGWDEALPS